MPSWRSSLPHARSHAVEHVGVVAAADRHLQPVQRQLRAGEGERRERGDLVGPPEGGVEVAEALHEARGRCASSPLQVSAPRSIARAGPAPARSDSRWIDQWSTSSPSLAAGMPNRAAGVATRRSQATASWVPAPEGGAVDGREVRAGIVAQRGEHLAQPVGEAGVLHAGEVGAGAEVPAGTGEHDHAGARRCGRGRRGAARAPRGRARCAARPDRS